MLLVDNLVVWPVDKLVALLTCVVKQGEPWVAALAGHQVDPLKQQAEQQRLMLERFQQEVSTLTCQLRYAGQCMLPKLYIQTEMSSGTVTTATSGMCMLEQSCCSMLDGSLASFGKLHSCVCSMFGSLSAIAPWSSTCTAVLYSAMHTRHAHCHQNLLKRQVMLSPSNAAHCSIQTISFATPPVSCLCSIQALISPAPNSLVKPQTPEPLWEGFQSNDHMSTGVPRTVMPATA